MSTDKEYLAPHLRKDVPTCNAVVIALTAVLSAICGSAAAILSAQLSRYRKDPPIEGYWMAGLLFVNPGLTGMIVAYKRRVMTLTGHLGATLISTILGGVALAYAVMIIYTDTCTPFPLTGECQKVPLMLLCVSSLVGSGGFCAISLFTTIYTYSKVRLKEMVFPKYNSKTLFSYATFPLIDHQARVAIQREEEEAQEKSRKKNRPRRAHENIAMDVNCPDRLSGQNAEVEFSSYL